MGSRNQDRRFPEFHVLRHRQHLPVERAIIAGVAVFLAAVALPLARQSVAIAFGAVGVACLAHTLLPFVVAVVDHAVRVARFVARF